jgi:hypothetical protein
MSWRAAITSAPACPDVCKAGTPAFVPLALFLEGRGGYERDAETGPEDVAGCADAV